MSIDILRIGYEPLAHGHVTYALRHGSEASKRHAETHARGAWFELVPGGGAAIGA